MDARRQNDFRLKWEGPGGGGGDYEGGIREACAGRKLASVVSFIRMACEVPFRKTPAVIIVSGPIED